MIHRLDVSAPGLMETRVPPFAAAIAAFDFIEGFYNPRRRHSALDYLSPVNFERHHQDAA